MKYVVAVSGGVDSVVLLDMLAKENQDIIVAHFDHGIRKESVDDAEFVKSLAEKYDLPYEMKREELGANASEELARDRRYAFLRDIAKRHKATIVTAHHADDMVESIAINLIRGTGWRGVAVLDSPDVKRPLIGMTKKDITSYAAQHGLTWREDATNRDTKYLRNDVRKRLEKLSADDRRLLGLYRDRQVALRQEIEKDAAKIIGEHPYARYLFTHVSESAGLELLRSVFVRECGVSPTRPQLHRALHAIKVLHVGKRHEAMRDVSLVFTRTHFTVNVLQ